MKDIKLTLIADGSSDTCLLEIIRWTLNDLYPQRIFEVVEADYRWLKKPFKSLEEKIKNAESYFPYDILIVHRDAEKTDKNVIKERYNEIKRAVIANGNLIFVCLVPVTMMEAWLLIDTNALKKAAGNRNYSKHIELPNIKNLEKTKDPKEIIHKLLKEISGLKGRNLDKFNVHQAVHLVAENIDDFSPLRNLGAFKIFENELKQKLDNYLKR